MFYITGDTHIPIDSAKLLPQNFRAGETLDENDYLIICGDFGGVWDDGPEHLKWLDFLESRRYNILFVDGNHENFDRLDKLDTEGWCGGKIHRVRKNIIHLMRGQVYNINGITFFTFGGGFSYDKERRTPNISWWEREMPSDEEYAEGLKNLEKCGFVVDYVITHTAPLSIIYKFYFPAGEAPLNQYLSDIDKKLSYNKWYFGHVHRDLDVDGRHLALYDRIIELGAKL